MKEKCWEVVCAVRLYEHQPPGPFLDCFLLNFSVSWKVFCFQNIHLRRLGRERMRRTAPSVVLTAAWACGRGVR